MQPPRSPPSAPNGYGYTGAMFPAPPCGWVGGGLVVVVVVAAAAAAVVVVGAAAAVVAMVSRSE